MTVGSCERFAGVFGEGQSVHISTQQQSLAAIADGSNNAVATAALGFVAQLGQLIHNIVSSLNGVHADFCKLVNGTTVSNHNVLQFKCSLQIIHSNFPPCFMAGYICVQFNIEEVYCQIISDDKIEIGIYVERKNRFCAVLRVRVDKGIVKNLKRNVIYYCI